MTDAELVEFAEQLYNYEASGCHCSTCSMPPCGSCENGIDEQDAAEQITKAIKEDEKLAYFLESIDEVVEVEMFDSDWSVDERAKLVDSGLCVLYDNNVGLSEELQYALNF